MHIIGQYQIDITLDKTFTPGSIDNSRQYDFQYFNESEYVFPTILAVKVYKDEQLFKSAIIASHGGGTSPHKNAIVYEQDRLAICCSDTIFCLAIPTLTLLWQTKADQATCFEIFKYNDSYIVHGELEISRLDKDGNILWQQGGADIFTTINGGQGFQLTEHQIIATDFENRVYTFDYNGLDLTDKTQFPWL